MKHGDQTLSRLTVRGLLLALVFAFLHHVDHVLRIDHSGWPFRESVNPFTYSLAAYPIILFAWLGPLRLFWVRWTLLASATAFTLYAHTVVESPYAQFHMWAHNASVHGSPVTNALDLESRSMGMLSVLIGMALNIVAVASTGLMLRDGLRRVKADTTR